MNRNTEAHFSSVPTAHVQRSVFDKSFSHKTSFNVGECIPIFCQEVLPGSTFTVDTAKVVRLQTMLAPIYDNIYLDTYYFFVPNRLVFDHWVEFMGENNDSAWIPSVTYQMPCISAPAGGFQRGTIADYLGLPLGVSWDATDTHAPIALPFRVYATIVNHFFRDQNLTAPLLIPKSQAHQTGSNGSDYINDVANGGKPFIAAKFHDYFTSALPSPQRGEAVRVPMSGRAPVVTGAYHAIYTMPTTTTYLPIYFSSGSSGYPLLTKHQDKSVFLGDSVPNPEKGKTYPGGSGSDGYKAPVNLWTTFEVNKGSADSELSPINSAGIDINALRLASVTQMYYEALARGGSTYSEQLLQFFGVRSPDARLQNPEYLGGNRISLNVHEVTNTAQSETDFLGDVGAMSVTTDNHSDFTRSFTEHGYVMGICVARYDHSYMQGIDKMWLRKDKLSFYNPLFANIGEQPIYNVELYANNSTLKYTSVFGYQEAWADYRHSKNRATSYLRPNINNNLGHWSLTDNYAALPTLSDGWIREDKSNVDRALAVSSSLSDQIFGDFYFNFRAVLPMPMYSVPGVLGRF